MTASPHIPVMLPEVVAALRPRDGGVYVDGTFGAGGYARKILKTADCIVYAFDRDPTAIARAHAWKDDFGDRLILIQRPFAEMKDALAEYGVDQVDGVVLDLGVSSMQLDEAERGFSFMRDGPLSMRMDGGRPDAADVIAAAEARDLAAIFRIYGEEKKASAIARAIVAARDEGGAIETTGRLAEIVAKASPGRPGGVHPATRVFQALRIFVNDELGQLADGLQAAERILKPGGRLVVVTFHSLEDRMVKRFFAARSGRTPAASRHQPASDKAPPSFDADPKALPASETEARDNPRARSAKLRAGSRLEAPAITGFDGLGLPRPIDTTFMKGRLLQ